MDIDKKIADKLNKLIDEKNDNVENIANKSGVSKDQLNKILCAEISVNAETLYKICGVLNVKLEEFFDDPLFND